MRHAAGPSPNDLDDDTLLCRCVSAQQGVIVKVVEGGPSRAEAASTPPPRLRAAGLPPSERARGARQGPASAPGAAAEGTAAALGLREGGLPEAAHWHHTAAQDSCSSGRS
jgi:hypothetical protein